MKKVLMITQHFPPEIGAASNRMEHVTRHLLKQGYQVYLVTTKPNYPHASLYKEVQYNDKLDEYLKIYRSPIIEKFLSEKINRLVNQIIFLCYALIISIFVCMKYSIKTCVTTSPPFLVNFVGLFLRLCLRVKWVMEIRDLWPDSMIAVKAIKPTSLLYKLLKKLEYLFYRVCSQVIVVTKSTKEILMNSGIKESKIHVITNGIPDWISDKLPLNQKQYKDSKQFNIVYIGNIGLSQNLSLMIDVANQLKEQENIQFYFVGEGLDKQNLIRKANQLGLSNVHFIGGITNKDQLIEWYLKADVGIVSLQDSPLFTTVIPSKIFEYGALGVPMLMIGAEEGEGAEILQKYQLGKAFQPDISILSNYVINLSNNHGMDVVQMHIEDFLSAYSWDRLSEHYAKIIEK